MTNYEEAKAISVDSMRVFFMHISKTGGSSLIDALSGYFGKQETCFWADQYAPHYEHLNEHCHKFKFCSGHFYVDDWNRISEMHAFPWKKVTILRDPFEQLVSHLRWMDSYNLPSRQHELAMMSQEDQVIVSEIRQVEFSSPESLDRYLTHLSPTGIAYFDNLQSRYFISGWRYKIDRYRPLDLSLTPYIRDSMRQFDFIGHLSAFAASLEKIALVAGIKVETTSVVSNKNSSPRQIDINNETVRNILRKRLIVDEWLCNRVLDEVQLSS